MEKRAFLLFLMCCAAFSCMAQIKVKNGDSLAFAGDKVITEGKTLRTFQGYIQLVTDTLKTSGIKIKRIDCNAASAEKLLTLLPKKVIAKKPLYLIVGIGFQEALGKNASLENYKNNVKKIFDLAKKNSINVIVMTSFVFSDNPGHANNAKLFPYNEFLRAEAKNNHFILADINKALTDELYSPALANLTTGKVTRYNTGLNGRGHFIVAATLLEALGISKEKVAETKKAWEKKYPVNTLYLNINFSDFLNQAEKASRDKMDIKQYTIKEIKEIKEKGKAK